MNKLTKKQNVYIRRKPNLLAREIDNEFIIFDTETGMLYKLNETAKYVWKALSKPKTIYDVSLYVSKRYDIPVSNVTEDVHEFVTSYINFLFSEFKAKK